MNFKDIFLCRISKQQVDQYFVILFYGVYRVVTFVESEGGAVIASGLGCEDQHITAQWATEFQSCREKRM